MRFALLLVAALSIPTFAQSTRATDHSHENPDKLQETEQGPVNHMVDPKIPRPQDMRKEGDKTAYNPKEKPKEKAKGNKR